MKDKYGREISYLRLSVTELCNLRCRYCMPEEGVCKKAHADMLTEEEMIQAVEVASDLGIRKVRITGGEPLTKPNIISICRRVAEVDGIKQVCLTTNGVLLPKLAKLLKEAGVQRINLSLDTLNGEKAAYMTRRNLHSQSLAGLHAALEAGFDRVKVNAVLIGGFNEDEIPSLAELTRQFPVDVRFIELMPIGPQKDLGPTAFLPCSTVLEALPELEPLEQTDGVAQLYRLPGALGTVGLIHPISQHFCNRCNRLRLTADGKLKPCLHGPEEYPIKGLDKVGMVAQFQQAIFAKPPCHPLLSPTCPSPAGRSMNQIGG